MKSFFVAIDLDKQSFRYLVSVNGIVITPVDLAEINKNQKVYFVPEDLFLGCFLWYLQHDTAFRRRLRRVLKSNDQLAVLEMTPQRCPVDKKRYNQFPDKSSHANTSPLSVAKCPSKRHTTTWSCSPCCPGSPHSAVPTLT